MEELDARQTRLLDHVLSKIRHYYKDLHGTRPSLRYPLNLYRLKKLCNRSGHAVSTALIYLANTVPLNSGKEPPIHYDRGQSDKNKSHRPYRIFLRSKRDSLHT